MQKFLFILAFEIDFTGLNDLSLNEDVDETKTSPFDTNEIDEEPEWHAEDNFIETCSPTKIQSSQPILTNC